MSRPHWVVFDVGGVLLDWQTSASDLSDFLSVDKGQLLKTLFKYAPMMNTGAIEAEKGWEMILRELGKDYPPGEVIGRWRAKRYWLKDSLKLAGELRASGYNLALFTNSWLGLKAANNEELPAELSLFTQILDSAAEKTVKPETGFYDLLEQTLKASGESIMLIDDDASNLRAALLKSWQVFHYSLGPDKGLESNNVLRAQLLK